MKKPILTLFVLLFALSHVAAQRVSNVVVSQEGKNIVITYDLSENANVRISGREANQYYTDYTMTSFFMHSVRGDVGKFVRAGKGKRIVWDVLKDYGDKFIYNNVQFTVIATPAMKTFILAEGAYSFTPQWGVGFMIGQVKQWGWFVKARSNFQFKALQGTKYQAGVGGVVYVYNEEYRREEVTPFYSGNKTSTEIIADAGTLVRLGCPLYLYAGAGFGMRKVQWETIDHQWIQYTPASLMGFSGDIGLMGCIKGFTISAGVNTINFKYMEIEAGIGWMF